MQCVDEGDESITIELPSPTATDNCSGDITWEWARSDIDGGAWHAWEDPGLDAPFNVGDTFVYFKAIDACGNEDDCSMVVTVRGCEDYCTYTQGYWGKDLDGQNAAKNPNIAIRLAQLQGLLEEPMTVGVLGVRSLTFWYDDTQVPAIHDEICIFKRLPAGGQPSALPEGAGDMTFDGNCNTTPSLLDPKKPDGRFKNVFLGQVIAYSLNLRLDDGPPLTAPICTPFWTWPKDGGLGTEYTIPDSVMTALGPNPTFGGLLTLANEALAGLHPELIGALNTAVSTINEAYDECRWFVACPTETP